MESSILNPREEHGGAFSHTPDSREDAASRRARECMSGASSNRLSTDAATLTESHAFWRYRAVPSRGGYHDHVTTGLHRASSWCGVEVGCGVEVEQLRCGGRMWVINSEQAAAEAKKAEGASCTSDSQSSTPHWKYCLRPGWILEMDVNNTTNSRPQKVVILLETR